MVKGLRVLVLEDMVARMKTVRQALIGHSVVHVILARDAIALLQTDSWDIVMLDHDLAEDHYKGDWRKGTGMEVVDFYIAAKKRAKVKLFLIHSMQVWCAKEMEARLKDAGLPVVRDPHCYTTALKRGCTIPDLIEGIDWAADPIS